MSCDIHLYIEVLTANGWELYSHPQVAANYEFFALIGESYRRKDIKPVAPLRGFPPDASYLVKESFRYWGDDAHCVGWLTAEEFQEAYNRWIGNGDVSLEYDLLHCYLEGDSFASDHKPEWIFDVRFVFWFDN